jgi:hypothetical protein
MFDKILGMLGSNLFDGVKGIIQTFKLPPEQQIQFEARMAELQAKTELDLQKIAADDRNSARQREMVVKDGTNRTLAYLIVAVFALAQYAVFTHQFPTEQAIMVSRVLGTIDMALGLVLGYYFGSSSGADHKPIDPHG